MILRALLRKRKPLLDGSEISLYVWVNEADLTNVHQAIYALYMELGRWDIAIRSGLGGWMLQHRCAGILGAQVLRYRRPLKRLQRFTLRTRIASWDDKWIYIEHRIERAGKTLTVGWVRLMFMDTRRNVIAPAEATRACGHDGPSPPAGELESVLEQIYAATSEVDAKGAAEAT